MSDDLKDRLRANHLDECYDAIYRIQELEAKLAKAVAFIEFLDENYRHVWGETARLKIRTLHAELTGGKDDTDR